MTEIELRTAVCAQARSWLGRKEADGSHREIIDIYNAGRPPGAYRMTYQDPWCAAFVSAVGMAAGLGDVLLPEVSCDRMIAAYRAAGRWVEADDYPAKPGDLIFYDWEDSGAGDNLGGSDHVGIIVADSDYDFTVIEGNKTDAVGTRTLAHNSRFIRGFAVPDYEKAGETDVHDQSADDSRKNETGQAAVVKEPGETPAKDETEKPDGAALCRALPELSYGCCGLHVVVMQGILIARGCSCGPDGADGDFGYNTRNALQNFQRAAGLTPDGVCGPMTWARLLGV